MSSLPDSTELGGASGSSRIHLVEPNPPGLGPGASLGAIPVTPESMVEDEGSDGLRVQMAIEKRVEVGYGRQLPREPPVQYIRSLLNQCPEHSQETTLWNIEAAGRAAQTIRKERTGPAPRRRRPPADEKAKQTAREKRNRVIQSLEARPTTEWGSDAWRGPTHLSQKCYSDGVLKPLLEVTLAVKERNIPLDSLWPKYGPLSMAVEKTTGLSIRKGCEEFLKGLYESEAATSNGDLRENLSNQGDGNIVGDILQGDSTGSNFTLRRLSKASASKGHNHVLHTEDRPSNGDRTSTSAGTPLIPNLILPLFQRAQELTKFNTPGRIAMTKHNVLTQETESPQQMPATQNVNDVEMQVENSSAHVQTMAEHVQATSDLIIEVLDSDPGSSPLSSPPSLEDIGASPAASFISIGEGPDLGLDMIEQSPPDVEEDQDISEVVNVEDFESSHMLDEQDHGFSAQKVYEQLTTNTSLSDDVILFVADLLRAEYGNANTFLLDPLWFNADLSDKLPQPVSSFGKPDAVHYFLIHHSNHSHWSLGVFQIDGDRVCCRFFDPLANVTRRNTVRRRFQQWLSEFGERRPLHFTAPVRQKHMPYVIEECADLFS